MRIGPTIFALTMLAGAGGTARAADEDVRCLLASNIFAKAEQEPAKRQIAMLSAYFYLGRIDARMHGNALAAALKAEAGTLTAETVGATMTACAKKVQSAGTAIRLMGQGLQKSPSPKPDRKP